MTKRKRIIRKDTEHALFGQADPLPAHKLPLNGEVLKNVRNTNVKLEGLQM